MKTYFRHMAGACVASLLLLAAGCAAPPGSEKPARPIRMLLNPVGKNAELIRSLAQDYEDETGQPIELVNSNATATERLTEILQYLGARADTIDIYMIDVVWPPLLGEHLVDLTPHVGEDATRFFPAIISNNTVDGRLVALPFYADAGMIYYRTDLLAEAGLAEMPLHWHDFEEAARRIQESRAAAGQPGFHAFIWPGFPDESLTCFALELQHAHGGGNILDSDRRVTVDNPGMIAALRRAAGWIGTISPPDTPALTNEACLQRFRQGDGAFLRGWTYMYAILNEPGSPVAGKIAVAPVPGASEMPASVLGGWQLAVSRYSPYPSEAARFIGHLTSEQALLRRAVEGGFPPTRTSVYAAPELARHAPHLPVLRQLLDSAIARPSSIAGLRYNEISPVYFNLVHEAIAGKRGIDDAITRMAAELRNTLD